MRAWLIALAVAAQVLVLAAMAGEREWIFRHGEIVYLRTAPVDPRDPFRGDFVRLQYEANVVGIEGLDPALRGKPLERHTVLYTRLRPMGEGVYEAAGATLEPPAEGPYLRGRVEQHWRAGRQAAAGPVFVKYGIEQLYVEQGRGREIEERRGRRADLQVPMEVELALSGSGKAVIRGYRWSRLGIKLEVVRAPARRDRNAPPLLGPLSPKLRLTLANVSDAPLSIADPGEHCALRLVASEWMMESLAPADTGCEGRPAAPSDVIVLAPGQSHGMELDLAEPRWHVLADGKATEIGALTRVTQFRIEYRAPEGLAATPALWQGRLASPRFNATGVVD